MSNVQNPADPRLSAPTAGSEHAPEDESHPVVLFDGVCNLCNGWVRFALDRDPPGKLRFAPLQSDVGQNLLLRAGIPATLDTIVFLEKDRTTTESTAVLRILEYLSGAWPLLTFLVAIPRAMRDAVYHVVATHRYEWFGRRAACRIPTPEERARFLNHAPHEPQGPTESTSVPLVDNVIGRQ